MNACQGSTSRNYANTSWMMTSSVSQSTGTQVTPCDPCPTDDVRRKLTVLPGSEAPVPWLKPWNKDYALSHNFAQAVVNQSLCFNFRQEMVSHLINRTLLGIHFMSLFTKYLEQEPATHKVPLNLVHKFT